MRKQKPNFANMQNQFVKDTALQFTLREMTEIFSSAKFWVGFAGVVLVLAVSGPFYTAINLNFPERLSYWLLISGVSFVVGLFISLWVGVVLHERGLSRFLAQALSGSLAGVPIAVIVWTTGNYIFAIDAIGSMSGFLLLVAQCCLISAVIAMLFFMLRNRGNDEVKGSSETITRSKFLKRIPVRLGTDLISIQSQDHYLKVTTRKSSEMLLMRMADACDELSDFDGCQVHRSWWVAISHVEAFDKSAGKGSITLSNGQQVPVSRSFLKQLEAAIANRY